MDYLYPNPFEVTERLHPDPQVDLIPMPEKFHYQELLSRYWGECMPPDPLKGELRACLYYLLFDS